MLEEIKNIVTKCLNEKSVTGDFYAFSERVFCFRETGVTNLEDTFYEPALCLVLQGSKQTILGERQLRLSAGDTVLISHHVPVRARITNASETKPYMALIVRLDMATIRTFSVEIERVSNHSKVAHSVASEKADKVLLETLHRLLAVLSDPLEAATIGESVLKELHLRILQAPHGGMLRQLASHKDMANRIAKAIQFVREHYSESLAVGILAREAGMSDSAFFQHFRRITGTSPNKYLKSLRLLKAQSLLTFEGYTVSAAAYAVGYESANHFSRDFTKKFGHPPKSAKPVMPSQ